MIYVYATILLAVLPVGWILTLLGMPGNWVNVGAAVLYALVTKDATTLQLGWTPVIAVVVLAGVGEGLEAIASAMGVAKVGGSRRGAILALIGSFVGAFVGLGVGMPIPVVGPLVAVLLFSGLGALTGAMLGEQWKGRQMDQTWQVGKAAFWGRLLGTAAKILIGSIIVVTIVVGLLF